MIRDRLFFFSNRYCWVLYLFPVRTFSNLCWYRENIFPLKNVFGEIFASFPFYSWLIYFRVTIAGVCTKQLWPSCFLRGILILTWADTKLLSSHQPLLVLQVKLILLLLCSCHSPCPGWACGHSSSQDEGLLGKRETIPSYKTSSSTEWSVTDVTCESSAFFLF